VAAVVEVAHVLAALEPQDVPAGSEAVRAGVAGLVVHVDGVRELLEVVVATGHRSASPDPGGVTRVRSQSALPQKQGFDE